MPSNTLRAFLLTALLAGCAVRTEAAHPPLDRVLPASTRASFAIRDLTALRDGWRSTQLSKLSEQPDMKPFLDDVRQRFEKSLQGLNDLADVALDDLREAAAGKVRLATIETASGSAAAALLAEVNADSEDVRALIAKIDAGLKRRGATHTMELVGGTTLNHYRWTGRAGGTQQSTYFLADEVLVVTSDADLARRLLARLAGEPADGLADTVAYRDIADRRAAATGQTAPQIEWFIDPINYQKLITGQESGFAKRHGLDGVKGVGGAVNFGLPEHDMLARVFIYCPEPRQGVMRLLRLLPEKDLAPLPWMIADVDAYTAANLQMDTFLDDVAPLFDEIAADGIEGTFNDILDDLKSEQGPGVDLRRELVPLLGPRVSVIADHLAGGRSDSGETLIAIQTSDEAATADVVTRLMRDDPQVSRLELAGYKYELWQVADAPDSTFPNMGMMVANGQLLAASHADLIRKVLLAPADSPKLADAADYKRAVDEMQALGGKTAAAWMFSRTRRDYRATYEMTRAGRLDDLDSAYSDALRLLFGRDEDRVPGLPQLDFAKLPPFPAVEPFLAPVGVFVVSQPSGWMVVGFTSNRTAAP